MENKRIQKNEEIDVEFIDLTYEGMGVAKVDGFPIFVEGALPKEKGKVKIIKAEQRYAFGQLVSLDEKSDDRVEVKEKHKILNHTVPLQHLSYEKQLEFKSKLVADLMAKEESLRNVSVNATLGMENPWHYRNKTQVPVRSNKKKMETGVFENRSHHLIAVDNFRINLVGVDEVVSGVRDILIQFNEKPYDEKTHTGNVRSIIVRKGYHTEEVMVIIVTRSKSLFPQSKIIPAIVEKFPEVVSIIHNINGDRTAEHLGATSTVIYGKADYKENILGKTYDVSAHSFLQVNTLQSERLYQTLMNMLELSGEKTVLDAYCGLGTISLSLSDKVKKVIGIEVVEEAIDSAINNAKKNNVENAEFVCGRVENVLSNLQQDFDVVIVDPPRKGLEAEVIDEIIKREPSQIAYISCNPATLVRDLKKIVQSGYKVMAVQPVDMFPQTVHVETIVGLQRRDT